jgi:hypothetical protein
VNKAFLWETRHDPRALEALDAAELLNLVKAAVRENERLLRACHAQRDRAREAERQFRVCQVVLESHLDDFDKYAAWVENSDSECSRYKWEATRGPSYTVTAIDRQAGTLTVQPLAKTPSETDN